MKEWQVPTPELSFRSSISNGSSCVDLINQLEGLDEYDNWGPFRDFVSAIPPGTLALDAIKDFAKSRALRLEEVKILILYKR